MIDCNRDTQVILREIAEAAILAPSLDELYQTVHRLVRRVLPADLFHINLLDEAAGEIVVPYTSDKITLIPERRPLDKGLTEYIMRQGRTVHITPAEMDRLSADGEYTLAKVQNVQTRHYLGAPLLNTKGKPFGVVSLITLGDNNPFKPEDVEILAIIAAQISLAIESKSAVAALHQLNAELEQCVESRTQELYAANQELTAMNEQMAAINQTLEGTNRQLEAEISVRQRKEAELSLRERQNNAITNLLIQPAANTDNLLAVILENALQLANAPAGFIGLQDEAGKHFVLRHSIGDCQNLYEKSVPVGQGLQGQVAKTGELLWVEDYRTYSHRILDARNIRVTTVIMVPLKIGGQVKGALTAHWMDKIHLVTEEQLDILRQFGVLASIALDRADSASRIALQNQLFRALTQTTGAVVGQLDIAAIFNEILENASALLGVPHGHIHILQDDGRSTKVLAAKGRFAQRLGGITPLSGITAKVMETGQTFYVEDYQSWLERKRGPFFDDITMAVQAPLKVDGKTVGSIGLSAFSEQVVLDGEKLEILDQFAQVASIAMKNALMHQETVLLAFHDQLTKLPNRSSLAVQLQNEMEQAKQGGIFGAVLFIDLDDLKVVNDNFGHSFGDAVIIAAGLQVVEAVGAEAFVARIGGDEFVVILSGEQNRDKVAQVSEKLVDMLSKDYEVAGERIHLSASLGAAFYPADGDTAEDILKKADTAMYAAKNAGKNCWCFYESHIGEESYARMMLTNSLRRSLERKELSVHYQAQVSCDKRKIIGFEALLRWNSPEHGPVSPVRFIPLAEQSNMIQPIGYYVLTQACLFIRRLKELGFPSLRVAVNISPRQLAADDFVDVVRKCIEDHGIEANQLELEVTENVLIESMEESIRKLLALRKIGVYLALDDFGTGYSSLTYLRHLPVNTLKIDKSFIDPIHDDASQERFVRFIIEMAHSLNLQVVAEGVEEKNQVIKLERLGCDIIQGYVYGRPVPAGEAINMLQGFGQ